jgi:G:T-mismatch repair DNA endonuclease (very short patch repair protein)
LNIPGLITFACPGGEYRIPGLKYKVDGYDEKTNTVYEYHGTYWHGHPSHKDYRADVKHPTTKLTWRELYEKTIERDRKIVEAGYNLVVKWGVEKNSE